MDIVMINVEAEHSILIDKSIELENEVTRLSHQNEELQKALEKQKTFHRNYADEVNAMEKVRIQDFKAEMRSLTEQNKNLIKTNRQLNIDVSFYKQAAEELSAESEIACNMQSKLNSESNMKLQVSTSSPVTTKKVTKRSVKTVATATSRPESIPRVSLACECKHTSSKVLTKVNDKMFQENKKLKSKISNLSATITVLTKKNKQLENFQKKIDNKKFKFEENSAELQLLVESTKKKNKHTFNAEALKMLREIVLK